MLVQTQSSIVTAAKEADAALNTVIVNTALYLKP